MGRRTQHRWVKPATTDPELIYIGRKLRDIIFDLTELTHSDVLEVSVWLDFKGNKVLEDQYKVNIENVLEDGMAYLMVNGTAYSRGRVLRISSYSGDWDITVEYAQLLGVNKEIPYYVTEE